MAIRGFDLPTGLTNFKIILTSTSQELHRIENINDIIKPTLAELFLMQKKIMDDCGIVASIGAVYISYNLIRKDDFQRSFTNESINFLLGIGCLFLTRKHFKNLFHVHRLIKILTECTNCLLKPTPPTNSEIQKWISNLNESRSFLKV